MRKQYLHLSAYSCDKCKGPVISGSLAVRESEIEKETQIRQVGAVCLSCGHRHNGASDLQRVRHFVPIEWEPLLKMTETGNIATAFAEALTRADLHRAI